MRKQHGVAPLTSKELAAERKRRGLPPYEKRKRAPDSGTADYLAPDYEERMRAMISKIVAGDPTISSRGIARQLGVSHNTVRKYRQG